MVHVNTAHERNKGIDLLRGLAVLSVILLHTNGRIKFSETYLGNTMQPMLYKFLFWSGFYGVCIFFVISGFLITTSSLHRWNALPALNPKQFYAMRFARIMPLLLLLLTVLSILHSVGANGFVINPAQASLPRSITAALLFHINWLELKVGYLPAPWDVLWSLSIEEMFYIFFPLVCVFTRSERNFSLAIAAFLLLSPFARTALYPGNELADRNHFAYVDAIAIGCIAAIITRRKEISPPLVNTLAVLGFSLMMLILVFRKFVFEIGLTITGLNVSLLAIGTALVLVWMQKRFEQGKQTFSRHTAFLCYMGRNSYEIYLTHIFVVMFAVAVYSNMGLTGEWTWALYAFIILGSAGLGGLVATYFSNPLNNRLRKLLTHVKF